METSSGVRASAPPAMTGYLAVLLAAACWATSGLFVKLILASSDLSAVVVAFWRDLVSFAALLVCVGALRPAWLRVQRRDLAWLVALGASLGANHALWNLGVMLNGLAVATVQQSAMPAIVAVVAWFAWREPLTWRKALAIVLVMAGTALVSSLDQPGAAGATPWGFLVGLGIPVAYAGWNLLSKKVRQRCNVPTMLTYAFGFSALVLLPSQLLGSPPRTAACSSTNLLRFAGLIGLSTLLPFLVYTWTLRRMPASVATILAMAEIPAAALYAHLWLDEQMAPSQVLGAALVVLGVALLVGRSE